MIWRGLQKSFARLAVCIIALGAVPSFAYVADNGLEYPNKLLVQDFAQSGVNGEYLSLGPDVTDSGTFWYVRYGQSNNPSYTARFIENPAGTVAVWFFFNSGQVSSSANTNRATWAANGFPPLGPAPAWSSTGQVFFEFAPPDPYEEAFPDWASASVKIPLGFSFGLVLWASVLAFHVPMQWVRSLSQNAS